MGRKKNNESSKGTSQNPWTVNCSTSARNMRKNDLAAVIFGCKHSTVKECFSKKLFGLPATHFAYITKIDPGLPLFLFNYSDRKLHGIFEATSKGQLNIDPYAWIEEGTESTPFPAQVRFTIKMRCQPLSEDQFQPIISENYYNEKYFWNELDHEQTRNLLAVFSSTPRSLSISTSENGKTLLKIIPSLDGEQDNVAFETRTVNNLGISYRDALGHGDDESKNSKIVMNEERVENYELERLPTCKPSYSDVLKNKNPVLTEEDMSKTTLEPGVNTKFPQTSLGCSWDAESSYSLEPGSSWESEALAINTNLGCSDRQNKEWGALEMHPVKPKPSWNTKPGDSSDAVTPASNTNPIYSDQQYTEWGFVEEHIEPNSSWNAEPGSNWDTEKFPPDTEQGYSDQQNTEEGSAKEHFVEPGCSWDDKPVSYWDSWLTVATGSAVINTKQGAYAVHPSVENSAHPSVVSHSVKESESSEDSIESETTDEDDERAKHHKDEDPTMNLTCRQKLYDFEPILTKLMQDITELKASHSKQVEKVASLELQLAESRREVRDLQSRFQLLELPPAHAFHSILIAGGFDSLSWLSTLDMYSPSSDIVTPLSQMNLSRSHAAIAKLNDEFFIFGGGDSCSNLCYDSVDSYNPLRDEWISRPSLNRGRGGLAGVSLIDKIFAIGGGNGAECFSDVEVFDADAGRWIPIRSMIQKRFATVTCVINGISYVAGGYDGDDYLKSVERYDTRVGSWAKTSNMTTRRGCHSMAVLNEKLYAIGGYDGQRMIPSIEVFDPRIGLWMAAEPMNESRGYASALTLGQSIYVIGGLKDNHKIIDTVECYKEGSGWQLTNLKGIGKRCFFSVAVM